MTINITTPVTGGAQTGLTSPTYTLVIDTAPDANARQQAVTALGGTQASVRTHSASDPFTITSFRPKNFAALGKPNPVTGVIKYVPYNKFRLLTRKGVYPLSGQPITVFMIDTLFQVPAGADTADPANLRAALSLHIGAIVQQSAGIGDTIVTGIM
ncbi:TPA_asm: coat protein [ssRNA phage SRR7976356_3]|uniref:Coat protein n=1 Tax=ssRNA phage SRR7976356_3 TaxID=2786734 RepID=A0A8S5L5P9_9VIRU|nr:coat protein [ssRNA phage SRR7976356_3]DAD52805.1 TPA_asm: coat protein [ssRNA phage SRR7976356_3]